APTPARLRRSNLPKPAFAYRLLCLINPIYSGANAAPKVPYSPESSMATPRLTRLRSCSGSSRQRTYGVGRPNSSLRPTSGRTAGSALPRLALHVSVPLAAEAARGRANDPLGREEDGGI